MKEIILLIALLVAIVLDIIRVYQYIQMQKSIEGVARDALIGKLIRIHSDWLNSRATKSFADYLYENIEKELKK